jgi:tetratricopeptide (TPR) repeat protein
MALSANNLGSVYMEQGRLQESEWALQKAIEFARQSKAKLMLANILGSMAETKLAMEKPDEALPFLDEAIAIAAEYPDDGWGRQIWQQYHELRNRCCMHKEA